MSEFKDYIVDYQHVHLADKKPRLRVVLKTDEFGPMESRMLDATNDKSINDHLLNSLADEVIDSYEARLKKRKIQISV